MVQTVAEYVNNLIKPGKALDPDMLAEWFNQQDEEQVQDVGEIFDDAVKTRQLFRLMAKDRSDMPDFNEAQKCESLAHAACALGIAPRLKVEDLRNRNRDAQLYLLTEVYAHDLPDNIGKYVSEQLKQRGQNM